MGKRIIYDDEARSLILKGAREVYKAVKTTYGPKGGNVAIAREFGPPISTHDGVTVAMSIDFDNDGETFGYSVGAEMLKDASRHMNKTGDGTTSVSILTYAIIEKAFRLIAVGHNPMLIKREIEQTKETLLTKLKELAVPTDNNLTVLENVATISAEDREIGKLIAKTVNSVGADGVVTIDLSNSSETTAEVADGYTFNSGYISSLFINDADRQEAVYEGVDVLILDDKFETPDKLFVFLKKYAEANRDNLLIICNDLKKEALSGVIYNKMKDILRVVAVKSPGFGDYRGLLLSDLSKVTGATVVRKDEIESAGFEVLGRVKKIVVGRDKTTILGGKDQKILKPLIDSLKKQRDNNDSKFEQARLNERIANLSGNVAIILVGGNSEAEVEEKKFRIDDAVAATKAALAEGIVSGGGVTFLELSKTLSNKTIGETIVKEALQAPCEVLMSNSGYNGNSMVERLLEAPVGFGIDVLGGKDLIDLKQKGIIDPALVIREAIINAISLANLAIMTNAIVVDKPKDREKSNASFAE